MALQDDEEERASAYLIKLFKHRPRSRHETVVRLQQRGFSHSAIETTIRRAEESGLMNDVRFAKLWVQDRMARKPRGRRALERELHAKGLGTEQIRDALSRVELDEETIAQQLVMERLSRYSGDEVRTQGRKLINFLRRRGFSYDVISRALRQALDEPSGLQ